MQTIIDIVQQRAYLTPNAVAYRFVQGAALDVSELSYGELWHLSCQLGVVLQERGLRGQQVLLVCKSQQHFVVSFFACLAAGVIAVPTALPRRKALIGRLQLLLKDAGAQAILSDSAELQDLAAQSALDYVDVQSWMDGMECAAQGNVRPLGLPPVPQDGIAFLQYTSGSTGDPKGVVVTHANLMANSAAISQAMAISGASAVFTALPLFHDMGLVGGVIQPMYAGCVGHCMLPAEFVQYPERWLQSISKFKITVSGGPNFMYELAARSIEAGLVDGCDLSQWNLAFCGAEPIRPGTVSAFSKRFAEIGFQAGAFYPCYGMAESTLFITGQTPGKPYATRAYEAGSAVGCGTVFGDTEVLIVDPDTRCAIPDRQVGEIWVRGSSVASGYWQRPDLSATTFQATLAGDEGKTYLRTGDLGFLQDAQLYVTARLKDVIVMYGKKYAPQDIEAEAQASHPAVSEQGGAAFSVTCDGADTLVLVCELRRAWMRQPDAWPLIARAIRSAISAAFGLTLDDVVFIKPTTLPRTSSGKVRRAQCRSDYLDGALDYIQRPDQALPASSMPSDAVA
ncbi:fatty acyl-AMP ligase [Janthinobacterium lividum]|uniref:fatty acyl-AMP ligase n=1 Tax=Janthinobacterium lividum TaxID=29581 RepID=UPI001595B7DE|nr:fatty acyl-AMP ligase [Janthinobacterium lividum]QKY12023.1 fatty acyl-AMP ligase [Janthinobacterium lividum]